MYSTPWAIESWRSAGALFGFRSELTLPNPKLQRPVKRIGQVGQALTDSCLVITGDADNLSGQNLDGLIQLKERFQLHMAVDGFKVSSLYRDRSV